MGAVLTSHFIGQETKRLFGELGSKKSSLMLSKLILLDVRLGRASIHHHVRFIKTQSITELYIG